MVAASPPCAAADTAETSAATDPADVALVATGLALSVRADVDATEFTGRAVDASGALDWRRSSLGLGAGSVMTGLFAGISMLGELTFGIVSAGAAG